MKKLLVVLIAGVICFSSCSQNILGGHSGIDDTNNTTIGNHISTNDITSQDASSQSEDGTWFDNDSNISQLPNDTSIDNRPELSENQEFPVNQVKTNSSLLEIDNEELIKIFEEHIIPNYIIFRDMYQSGRYLKINHNDHFDLGNGTYALVENIANVAELKVHLEHIFSANFLKERFYPYFFENETPLFLEKNSKLYYNYNTGGGGGYVIDFESAAITNKSEGSFDVTVEVWVYERSEMFTFRIINQNGCLVMDNDYLYKYDIGVTQSPNDDNKSLFEFSFMRNGDLHHFIFGNRGEMTLPNSVSELFVLVINGNFTLDFPIKNNNEIFIKADTLSELGYYNNGTGEFTNCDIKIDTSASKIYLSTCEFDLNCYTNSDSLYVSLNELSSILEYDMSILRLYSNNILNYELSVVIIETDNNKPIYSKNEAKCTIYNHFREEYDNIIKQIDSGSGDIYMLLSQESIDKVKSDSRHFSIDMLGTYGRYYIFDTSFSDAKIYFNKYTGEIFSDDPIHSICIVNISEGLYPLTGVYW